MRRFAALIVSVSVLALSLVMFTFPAAALATTCHRATITMHYFELGPTGVGVGADNSPDVLFALQWTLFDQGNNLVGTVPLPGNSIMVRYNVPQTLIVEDYFDSSLTVGFGVVHIVFFTTGGDANANGSADINVGPCGGATAVSPLARIGDGRLNATDLAAPAAVYCAPSDGLDIWDINGQGQGSFGVHVSKADIDAALAKVKSTNQNVLIAQWGDKSLTAFPNGQLVLLGHDLKEPGKVYQTVFSGSLCS